MCSGMDNTTLLVLSSLIRISTDRRIFAPPRSFSQLVTSFFGAMYQGIHLNALCSLNFLFLIYLAFLRFFLWVFFVYFPQKLNSLTLTRLILIPTVQKLPFLEVYFFLRINLKLIFQIAFFVLVSFFSMQLSIFGYQQKLIFCGQRRSAATRPT